MPRLSDISIRRADAVIIFASFHFFAAVYFATRDYARRDMMLSAALMRIARRILELSRCAARYAP